MKTIDRILEFSQVNPNTADTGCGDVYPLVSTDLITPSPSQTASLALAHQTELGLLHEHKKTREVYICVDGKGSVDWDTQYVCSITEGDVIDIAPGTLHGLNAAPGKSVQVLVVSHPAFDPTDNYKIPHAVTKREEKNPPFFMSGAQHYLGTLVEHPHIIIRRLQIIQPYIADTMQLLFIVCGAGTFKVNKFKAALEKYDSVAMQPGDSITPEKDLVVITAQVKE